MVEQRPRRSAVYSKILLTTIEALKKLDGKGKVRDINELVFKYIEQEEMPETEQSQPMSNEEKENLKNYLGWTRHYLYNTGDLKRVSRGVYELTEAGYKIRTLEDATRALRRYDKVLAERNFRKISTPNELPEQDPEPTPSENRNFVINPDTLPYIPGIMLATIIAIKELGGSGHIYEIIACVIKNERISEEEQSYIMPNDHRSKLNYYLAWVRVYLKRSGDLENPGRGVWALTESGFGIDTLQDAEEARDRYKERDRAEQTVAYTAKDTTPPLAYLSTDDTTSPDEEHWKSVLLKILKKTDPNGFEELCGLILRKAGFIKVKVTALPNVADGGVDGVGFLREKLLSRKIYFQCKRTKNSISVDAIRDFRGALDGRANQGLFITTSYFTDDSVKEAVRDGALLIDLIDGDDLCDLLKDNNLGFEINEDGQKTLTPEWFDRFNTV